MHQEQVCGGNDGQENSKIQKARKKSAFFAVFSLQNSSWHSYGRKVINFSENWRFQKVLDKGEKFRFHYRAVVTLVT